MSGIPAIFKKVPPEQSWIALLELLPQIFARPARGAGQSDQTRLQFFNTPENPADFNPYKEVAELLYSNRSFASEVVSPGTSPKQFLSDVRRWRGMSQAWESGYRTHALFAAWRQARFLDLSLCEVSHHGAITRTSTSLQPSDNQNQFWNDGVMVGVFEGTMDVGCCGEGPTGLRPQGRRPVLDPDPELYQKTIEVRRSVIAEFIDCPVVLRSLSRTARQYFEDLKKLIVPLEHTRLYLVTVPGVSARIRSTELRKKGWIVVWVTSGTKTGNYPHTHLLVAPPRKPRDRNGQKSMEQMPEASARAMIKKTFGGVTPPFPVKQKESRSILSLPDCDGPRVCPPKDSEPKSPHILTINSLAARIRTLVYLMHNFDEPLFASSLRNTPESSRRESKKPGKANMVIKKTRRMATGKRFAMSQKGVTRLTAEEKSLIHPRCTKSEMSSWINQVHAAALLFGYPLDGPKRWVYAKRRLISEMAKMAGPDWSVYDKLIPDELRINGAKPGFSIMVTLNDGRDYALHFFGLGSPVGYSGLNDLRVDVYRKTHEGEDPWGMPGNWPVLAVQLLGIHANVTGS